MTSPEPAGGDYFTDAGWTDRRPETQPPSGVKGRRWLIPTIAGVAGLVLGFGAGQSRSADPTASPEYTELSASLTAVEQERDQALEQRKDTEEQLATAEVEVQAFASLETEVTDREKEIAEREEEVTSLEADLTEREDAVAEQEQELARQEKELAEQQKTLAEAEADLTTREKGVAAGEAALKERETELAQSESVVAPAPLVGSVEPAPQFSTDPRFSSCKDAKANNYGPYRSGVDPEYDWYRDGDNDGIVCE